MSGLYEKPARKPRPRTPKESATRIRTINIGRMYKRCLTAVSREIERLMIATHGGALTPADGKMLIELSKYIGELKAVEDLDKLEAK